MRSQSKTPLSLLLRTFYLFCIHSYYSTDPRVRHC